MRGEIDLMKPFDLEAAKAGRFGAGYMTSVKIEWEE